MPPHEPSTDDPHHRRPSQLLPSPAADVYFLRSISSWTPTSCCDSHGFRSSPFHYSMKVFSESSTSRRR
ncbi:unnamed protein product [Linum trigynum]|uniref:Uncharacterized protein n=1 Tax=Linum trigynum TaxID=586398 RepID=A0AAV2GSU8_9ROSI